MIYILIKSVLVDFKLYIMNNGNYNGKKRMFDNLMQFKSLLL